MQNHVIHRDIKSDNVFVRLSPPTTTATTTGCETIQQLALGDFDTAKRVDNLNSSPRKRGRATSLVGKLLVITTCVSFKVRANRRDR